MSVRKMKVCVHIIVNHIVDVSHISFTPTKLSLAQTLIATKTMIQNKIS